MREHDEKHPTPPRRTAAIGPALGVVLALWAMLPMATALGENGTPAPDQGPPTVEQDLRININEAGPEELTTLPGIGPSRARAVIEEREKRRFRRPEDIMRVPGIGRKTFGRIRRLIRVR